MFLSGGKFEITYLGSITLLGNIGLKSENWSMPSLFFYTGLFFTIAQPEHRLNFQDRLVTVEWR